MKTSIEFYSLLKIINTAIYYLGIIDFCFGGCISSLKRCNGKNVFIHGLAACSFGGVTRDTVLTPFFTGVFIMPGLMQSFDTWLITIIIVCAFRFIFSSGKHCNFDDTKFVLPFLFLDTLGLGNFTVIGILAAIKLGINLPAVQVLYGIVTATGGGVVSILMWAPVRDKANLMKNNLWYYKTAAISSIIACYGISRGFNCEAMYLACSAFCATVYITRTAIWEGIRSTYIRCLYYKICTDIHFHMKRLSHGEYFRHIRVIPGERSKSASFLMCPAC